MRIIIDMLRSNVNRFVKLHERVVLPRLRDVVEGLLWLQLTEGGSANVEQVVTDFCDAFHTILVHEDEKRHQIARAGGDEFVGYDTVVFGGGASPLI